MKRLLTLLALMLTTATLGLTADPGTQVMIEVTVLGKTFRPFTINCIMPGGEALRKEITSPHETIYLPGPPREIELAGCVLTLDGEPGTLNDPLAGQRAIYRSAGNELDMNLLLLLDIEFVYHDKR